MIKCSQCGMENAMIAQFCEGCRASFAAIQEQLRAADEEEADLLRRQAKKASSWMFAVAVLAVIGTVAPSISAGEEALIAALIGGSVIGALFMGLGFWARRNPLAASITGLVLLSVLWIADAVMDPRFIYRGIVIKVILVVVLVRAIRASLRHRQLVADGRVEA